MSKIILTGCMGYEGWPLLQKLVKDGHNVLAFDNNMRAKMVREIKSDSIIPIHERDITGYIKYVDLCYPVQIMKLVELTDFTDFDTIIHLAAQPSMPYSMERPEKTLKNNNDSTRNIINLIKEYNPNAHLIFTSTMGEYGTPNVRIKQGYLETLEGNILNFPRDPSSYYHLSKVYDSQYILLSNKLWDLKATILMQGVVYGTSTSWLESPTRWDCDYYFGTVLNRFMAQAIIGEPMTVYGKGNQSRGLLHLEDGCNMIASCIGEIPNKVKFYNNLTTKMSIMQMAKTVQDVGMELGLDPQINTIKNPRKEADYHQYDVDFMNMPRTKYNLMDDIKNDMEMLLNYKDRIVQYKQAMNKS